MLYIKASVFYEKFSDKFEQFENLSQIDDIVFKDKSFDDSCFDAQAFFDDTGCL